LITEDEFKISKVTTYLANISSEANDFTTIIFSATTKINKRIYYNSNNNNNNNTS